MTHTTTQPDVPVTAAPSLVGVHHLGLTVRDIHDSETWYAEVLGLVRAFVEPHPIGGGHTVVMTRPGTALFLGLDHHPQADLQEFDARRTGLDHLALRLGSRSDLDAWLARLAALGIQHGAVHESDDPAYATVLLHDPDGIPIELFWSAA
jgi:glyoxylase I family protein